MSDPTRKRARYPRLTWAQSAILLVPVALFGAFTSFAQHSNCTGNDPLGGPGPAPDPGTPLARWCGHFDVLDGSLLTLSAVSLAAIGIVAVRRRFVPSLIVCVLAVVPASVAAVVSANLDGYLPGL